jgi:hypothetical protein
LAFSPEDWRAIEAHRADPGLPAGAEVVAHCANDGDEVAACGALVVRASPTTMVSDPFLAEQWGPVRLCARCAAEAGISRELD